MQANFRIVKVGDAYGLNNCLTNSGPKSHPMVEVYDGDYAGDPRFEPEGQFVARYRAETLIENMDVILTQGLCLDGGIPKWRLTAEQVEEMFDFMSDAGVCPDWT